MLAVLPLHLPSTTLVALALLPIPTQTNSHDEPDIRRLAPVLEILEILKERRVVKVPLHMQFVQIKRVGEALNKLGLALPRALSPPAYSSSSLSSPHFSYSIPSPSRLPPSFAFSLPSPTDTTKPRRRRTSSSAWKRSRLACFSFERVVTVPSGRGGGGRTVGSCCMAECGCQQS